MRLALLAVLAVLAISIAVRHEDSPRVTAPEALPKRLPPGPYDGQPAALGDTR